MKENEQQQERTFLLFLCEDIAFSANLYPFLPSQLRITTGKQSMQSMICKQAILKTSCVIILSKKIVPIFLLHFSP